ncbi:lipopolysaccharide biosynthesis protein [Stratiformator vulcanicus]|uniref:lipopolysaccharide biosynthesis protein n=1 Tax=Stratiformator vulcanicus TaxID=2527980 RepID=UPI0011A75A3E|nr:lipopolysaccharide biosynthesis protein [Stratiformator vulcanicus]
MNSDPDIAEAQECCPSQECLPEPEKIALQQRVSIIERVKGLATHHAFLSIFDQGLVAGASFVTSVLVGRYGGKEMLGLYALAWSLTLFLRSVQEQVVSAPYVIYCRRKTGRRLAGYAGSSLLHQGTFSLLSIAGLSAAIPVVLWQSPGSPMVSVLAILTLAIPAVLLREFARHYDFAHFKIYRAITLDGAATALQLILLATLLYWNSLTAVTALAAMAIACFVPTVVWLIAGASRFRFNARRSVKDWNRNWFFAKWAVASQLLGSAMTFVAPWIIVLTHGEAATGVFAAGSTLVGIANMFVIGVANYIGPKTAEAYAEGGVNRLVAVLKNTVTLFIVVLGIFCIGAFGIGNVLAAFVYGGDFAVAGPIIAILSLNMFANALSITAGNGLWAMHEPAANFRADVASIVVGVIATVALIGPFGAAGAAFALLASGVADCVIRFAILRVAVANRRRQEGARNG